jgi:hypothetical protein
MAFISQGNWLVQLTRQRSVQSCIGFWLAGSVAVFLLCRDGPFPLNRPALAGLSVTVQVLLPVAFLALVLVQMGVVHFLAGRRTVPDLAARAPAVAVARREVLYLWVYGVIVLVSGRLIGLHFFGEGIGLHMNGAIFGCTRMVSQTEVWVWAGYNFVFYALIPYAAFRARGYSHEALGLKSNNLRNDLLIIFVIMAIGSTVDLLQFGPPGIFKAYLTLKTGNAWVHMWAYHSITPHVTNDTPMLVDIFHIQ